MTMTLRDAGCTGLSRRLGALGFAGIVTGLSAVLSGCGGGSTLTVCTGCISVPPIPVKFVTSSALNGPGGQVVSGQSTQLMASVTPMTTTGTVLLSDTTDGMPVPVTQGTLQQGTAVLSLVPQNAGTRTYVATYQGDNTYSGSQAAASVAVVSPSSTQRCGLGNSAYAVSSGSGTPTQTSFVSTMADESAVCAQNAGTTLSLVSPVIVKSGSGKYEPQDPSGINAAVLAFGSSATMASGAVIDLQGRPSIVATGSTYGVFASGAGATLNLSGGGVASTGAEAAMGAGDNGQINVTDASVTSDGDPLEILQGGSAVLTNIALSSTGDGGAINLAGPPKGTAVITSLRIVGGSIASAAPVTTSTGPNFIVTGHQTASIYLSHVDLTGSNLSGGRYFLNTEAGSVLSLTLDQQAISGVLYATPGSSLTLQHGSSMDATFASFDSITLDASSTLNLHATIALQVFNDPGGISGTQVLNVTGNGQTIRYSNAMNPQLGGLTYTLNGSGLLQPY